MIASCMTFGDSTTSSRKYLVVDFFNKSTAHALLTKSTNRSTLNRTHNK